MAFDKSVISYCFQNFQLKTKCVNEVHKTKKKTKQYLITNDK